MRSKLAISALVVASLFGSTLIASAQNQTAPGACKYPPAEPGALGIGPLEAATLDPKLYLFSRRTKYSRPRHPDLSSNFFCATSENRCLLIFASPLDGLRSHDCPSSNFLSCAWWLTIGGFGDGRPPQMSNLYCLPGRAGGSPGYARFHGRKP